MLLSTVDECTVTKQPLMCPKIFKTITGAMKSKGSVSWERELSCSHAPGQGGSGLGTSTNHSNNQSVPSSGIPNHMHVGTGPPPQFNRMEEMVTCDPGA